MFKKDQKGMIDPVIIVIIILVLVVGGLVYWRTKPKEQTSQSRPVQTTQSQEVVAEEESEVPEGWVKYANESMGISFHMPPDWKTACEYDTFVLTLIEQTDIKCATEGTPDGPIFSLSSDIAKECPTSEQPSEYTTSECQKIEIAGEEIVLTKHTYIKDGEFGTPEGSTYNIYAYTNPEFKNLEVKYTRFPEWKDNTETVEKVMATIRDTN